MDYTQSNAFVVDAGTGFNRHEDNAAVPTAVTKKDMNSLIWSLMEVVKFGGQAGAQFDPAVPATYKVLLSALKAAFGGNVTTVNAANSPFVLTKDHAGLVIMDATAGNASVTLPAANALSALKFDFRRKDASANMATVNRAGADTIDGALTSFTLSPGKACKVASDGGAAWSTVAFVDGLKEGFSRCVNNASQSNAATPNSKVDLLADVVIVYSPATGETIRKAAPGTITNDVTVAGPAANGRDRAAVFPASSWVHFYWALNPSTGTLITLSSLQPPTAGPALPAGYTHWAYSHPQWYDGASILRRVYVRGGWVGYQATQLALSGGTSTAEATVSLAPYVPPNALRAHLDFSLSNGAGTSRSASIRLAAGVIFASLNVTISGYANQGITVPNVGQSVLYTVSDTSVALTIAVFGYAVSNGDS